MVTCYSPRARAKDGQPRFGDNGLRKFCEQFTKDFGVPVIPNNRGWERYGEWCGQEYFPPFPDQPTFERQARIIRETGGLGMIMLSGWRWTIDKPQPGGKIHSNQELFDREIHKHATCEADGVTPRIKTSEKTNDWHGTKHARLCPATAFAQNTVIDTAKACVKAGYPVIHFDQEVSGPVAGSFCGSKAHGHEPGYGRWVHQAMADMYERLRAECAPLSPDFTLSMEEPNELYLPWLNFCQSRPNGLNNAFPMKPPLTRVVPLFSFLYHEHLVGWIAFYPWRSQGHHIVTVAQGFAAGMMPGVHIESTYRWKPDVREAFKTMVRNCSRLYVEEGMDALVFGRMLKPLALDVPERVLRIGKDGKTIRVPAVFHSVWQRTDGQRCVTLFNPEREPHVVRTPQLPDPVTVPALDAILVPLP